MKLGLVETKGTYGINYGVGIAYMSLRNCVLVSGEHQDTADKFIISPPATSTKYLVPCLVFNNERRKYV